MRRDIIILLAISAVVLLTCLGSGSLSSWDEAFYAQVSREMYESGDLINLTWWGSPWSDKPPLYMLGTVLCYKIFGVNEFSARLTSAASGIALIIVLYLFISRILSERAGFLSAIMMLGIYHFVLFAKSGTLDVTFSLFTLLSVYFAHRSEDRPREIIYAFLFFAMAFLTKGVGAFLIPVILCVYFLAAGAMGKVFNKYFFMGVLVFIVTAGSWYVAAYMNYGEVFLKGQFLQHLVSRTSGSMDGHTGSWLSYINAVLYKGKIWGTVGLSVFPLFLFYAVREKDKKRYILAAWLIVTFVLFSAIRTKLHWYIMPVYPAVAASAAWWADKFFKKRAGEIVVLITLLCVIYFGVKKDIFTLDYNKDIKRFSECVRDNISPGTRVYLYDIGDPGMRFYLWNTGARIKNEKTLRRALAKKGVVIITSEKYLKGIPAEKLITCGGTEFGAFRIK